MQAQTETANFKEKLQKMNIKQIVSSELKKPTYPFNLKGRHTGERRQKIKIIDIHNALF